MKRCVVITGSSRGIGFGIARAFAAQGDRIVLNGRVDENQLSRAVEELRAEFGVDVMGICADLSNYDSADIFFQQVEEHFGACDVLVNNAGAAHLGLFTDMTPGEISHITQANLHTVFNCCHLAVPAMVRAKAGCIINVSSIWGVTGASCEAVYSAAKAGVIGFTKSLAKELGPSGVRVNAIACGAFETRMNGWMDEDEKKAFTEEIPLGRFGKPCEAGDLAVFLASDGAGYLTGQVIGLDGGFV